MKSDCRSLLLVVAVSTISHECSHHRQGACQGEFLDMLLSVLTAMHPVNFRFYVGLTLDVTCFGSMTGVHGNLFFCYLLSLLLKGVLDLICRH